MKQRFEFTEWSGKTISIAVDFIGQIEPEKVEGKDYSWIVTKAGKQIRTRHSYEDICRTYDECFQ